MRTGNGSAIAGTNDTALPADQLVTIEAKAEAATVTVPILKAEELWDGEKAFFVEAYDIQGPLFNSALRCSTPICIEADKDDLTEDFTLRMSNLLVWDDSEHMDNVGRWDISKFYHNQLMNKLGIMNGVGENTIRPQGQTTRAENAATLHRFAELIK